MIKRRYLCFLVFSLLLAFVVGGCAEQKKSETKETMVKEIDLFKYKDSKPERTMRLLFIHHSCGGNWLADKGDDMQIIPDTCIYKSNPNGGGLKSLLQQNNYEVHEAAYKSSIGDKTDVCDWNAKFRERMEDILRCDLQDERYKDPSVRNEIVMFKSCFPSSEIISEGKGEGNPDSSEKTTANYRAAYRKLLGYFDARPDTLFVVVTAPPVVKNVPSRTKEFIKTLIGSEGSVKAIGERARRFNNWLKDTEKGWLAEYQGKNVVVFDYYDTLTGHGKSDFLIYPTRGGADSHPSSEGNSIATREFVTFLNKSVSRFLAPR
jgi:hypothetical protein